MIVMLTRIHFAQLRNHYNAARCGVGGSEVDAEEAIVIIVKTLNKLFLDLDWFPLYTSNNHVFMCQSI